MRKLLLLAFFIVLVTSVRSQNITPAITTEVCPGVDITFTVSIQGVSPSIVPTALNIAPSVVQQPFNSQTSNGTTTFNFIGRFVDANNKHLQ